ncbi:MAG TPA: DUF4136 domain-containing protein [Steroidobacteraceae bacterium]|nr:DUF4136 domain-containing protein [Steroidobacteraceae bacterium]
MDQPRHSHASFAFPILLLALLNLAGCASTPPPVHSMRDPQANFGAFKTFAWDKGPEAQASAPPVSILDSNIRTAIAGELQRKGYAEAEAGSKSDLVLHYETAAAEKLKSNPFRIGIGMGGVGNSGAAGVGVSSPSAKNVREGTLVLRVIDPARNAEVWNGRVSRELGKGGPPDPALIQTAVGELLNEFPVSGSAPQ